MYDPVRYVMAGGFKPDPWQIRFLRSGSAYRMLNCSRQVGKSTTVAWGALHRAIYYPNSLILLVSRGERQSIELMIKVREAMSTAVDLPGLVRDGTMTLEFDNGSRMLALPGKGESIRGFSSVNLLVLDEAALIPNDLYVAVRPMLAVSQGDMWTLSTPFGARGWWHDIYKKIRADLRAARRPRWEYYEIPATACPRITAEFLEEERLSMGEWWYRQEYECRFLDPLGSMFTSRDVDAAFAEETMAWAL
jgi:hypothetical protein